MKENNNYIFVGNVIEREIDYGNDLEFITEVRDEKGNSLSEVLDDYMGQKVKIKIEVIS